MKIGKNSRRVWYKLTFEGFSDPPTSYPVLVCYKCRAEAALNIVGKYVAYSSPKSKYIPYAGIERRKGGNDGNS